MLSQKGRRVVVTGLGAVSPIGPDLSTSWTAMLEGESGIVSLKGDEEFKNLKSQVGGKLHKDFNLDNHQTSFSNARVFSLTHAAFKEALESSGKKLETDQEKYRSGIIIGNQFGANENIAKIGNVDRGLKKDTTSLLKIMNHMVAGLLAIDYDFQGPTASASTASSSGAVAIGEAFRKIKHGYADFIIAGGADFNLNRPFFQGMENFGATCRAFNDTPESACRPFDRTRAGPVLSDGAGLLALEDYDSAVSRGADILAEIVGYGHSTDAFHILSPINNGLGVFRAAKLALLEAGVTPDQIDHINSHATSTPVGDPSEILGLRSLIGNEKLYDLEELERSVDKEMVKIQDGLNHDVLSKVSVFAPKGHIGHTFCAAGGIETVFGIKSMQESTVPMTLNLKEEIEEGEGLNFVKSVPEKQEINYMLKTSLAFGGHNNVLIFKSM
ncbi:unnamed protein product [Moneuplotes crassus]|uniref:beta-ketoacyl-[acyl-carrier-protein] synthase I n=1 Tax=Euplotes crassus TaxID=5936 RepID=A0AAD1XBC4_EUPCR|nr:unnamed protein product [Moneuplotes crassus]